MDEYIKNSNLRIECNITFGQVIDLSIQENFGLHGCVHITADIEHAYLEVINTELSGQPIKVYADKDDKAILLFHGIINEVSLTTETEYALINLSAYTLSWLMDLEQKSRSFQDTSKTIHELIETLTDEYSFKALCNAADKEVVKPFIQYKETDWRFLLRLSSHIKAHVIPASDFHKNGLYIGFREKRNEIPLKPLHEVWCMDIGHVKFENWKSKAAAYYEVISSQIFHLGESVLYKGEMMWVHKVFLCLKHGVLQGVYRLASKNHMTINPEYNKRLKGVSLSGTVLERREECIRIHLDIDEEQNSDLAFFYPWFPEYGNLLYCMPEVDSKIRLLVPNVNEQEAIGIQCIRQNGTICDKTQNPKHHWFETADNKNMTLQPELFELSAPADRSKIQMVDNSGCTFSSQKQVLIQAKGNLAFHGNHIIVKAPKEVIAVRRQVGEPTVVNICNNLDALGGKCTFKNLEELRKTKPESSYVRYDDQMKQLGAIGKEQMKKVKEKKLVQLKELMESDRDIKEFELGSNITKIIAAVPQRKETDPFASIMTGFRPMFGKMKGE